VQNRLLMTVRLNENSTQEWVRKAERLEPTLHIFHADTEIGFGIFNAIHYK